MRDTGTPQTRATWSRTLKWPWLLLQTVMSPSGPPVDRGGVRLNVALVNGLGAELPLNDNVGVLESLFDVAHLEQEMVGDVGAGSGIVVIPQAAGAHRGVGYGGQPLVQHGGIGLHGFQHVGHGVQNLVLDLDEIESLLGDVGAGGGYGGDGVTLVQRLVGGQTVVAEELGVDHGCLGLVADAPPGLRQVGGGHDTANPLHGRGLAGVDGLDAGVGMGAAQHPGAMEQSRQADVGAIAGAPGDLFGAVLPDGPSAHDVEFLVGKHHVLRLKLWPCLLPPLGRFSDQACEFPLLGCARDSRVSTSSAILSRFNPMARAFKKRFRV